MVLWILVLGIGMMLLALLLLLLLLLLGTLLLALLMLLLDFLVMLVGSLLMGLSFSSSRISWQLCSELAFVRDRTCSASSFIVWVRREKSLCLRSLRWRCLKFCEEEESSSLGLGKTLLGQGSYIIPSWLLPVMSILRWLSGVEPLVRSPSVIAGCEVAESSGIVPIGFP